MQKNVPLVDGEIYHIFNKSIAGYQIFNNPKEYFRMLNLMRYYQIKKLTYSFSDFCKLIQIDIMGFDYCFHAIAKDEHRLVDLLAFCFMPTHFHFILKQVCENGISTYISNILNSYTRFFNLTHKRKGPLWVGRFGRRLIKTDEDFLHMSRYVHLNPTTSGLVKNPQKWEYSSYREYLKLGDKKNVICNEQDLVEIEPKNYKIFVNDHIGYQKELVQIKHLIME